MQSVEFSWTAGISSNHSRCDQIKLNQTRQTPGHSRRTAEPEQTTDTAGSPQRAIKMVLSKFRQDLNKVKFNNRYKLEEAAQRTLIVTLGHPFSYSRILMQVGYEPFSPYLVDTLFGGSKYVYPSVFKFIEFIRTEDGIAGLFRGVGFRICSELAHDFFYVNTLDLCHQIERLANGEEAERKKKDKESPKKKKRKYSDSYEADDESDEEGVVRLFLSC